MNKIIKISVICLLLLGGVLISGCVSSNTVYYYPAAKNNTITLYQDGTFLVVDGNGRSLSGKYKIQDNSLYFILPLVSYKEGDFHDNGATLVDNEGFTWVRK